MAVQIKSTLLIAFCCCACWPIRGCWVLEHTVSEVSWLFRRRRRAWWFKTFSLHGWCLDSHRTRSPALYFYKAGPTSIYHSGPIYLARGRPRLPKQVPASLLLFSRLHQVCLKRSFSELRRANLFPLPAAEDLFCAQCCPWMTVQVLNYQAQNQDSFARGHFWRHSGLLEHCHSSG